MKSLWRGSSRIGIAWPLLLLILLLLTAVQSQGYWHPDEHFQILEFANFKLGLTPESELPWEYAAKLRPWTLPAATLVILKALRALHVDSPHSQMLVLRLLTALCSAAACLYFLRALARSGYVSPRQEVLAQRLFALLWFVPFLWVRHTSESWSSLFFYAGAALQLEGQRQSRALPFVPLATVLFALSFHCRFQAGFLILGFRTVAADRRECAPDTAAVARGSAAAAGDRSVCDRCVGYGTPTFTVDLSAREPDRGGCRRVRSDSGMAPVWLVCAGVSAGKLGSPCRWAVVFGSAEKAAADLCAVAVCAGALADRAQRATFFCQPVLDAAGDVGGVLGSRAGQVAVGGRLQTPFVLLNLPVGMALGFLPASLDIDFLQQVWNRVDRRHATVEIWEGSAAPATQRRESPFVQADLPTSFYNHPSSQRRELAQGVSLATQLRSRKAKQPIVPVFVIASPQYHPLLWAEARALCVQTGQLRLDWLWTALLARLGNRLSIHQWYLFEDCHIGD
jgi:hypothetical protein